MIKQDKCVTYSHFPKYFLNGDLPSDNFQSGNLFKGTIKEKWNRFQIGCVIVEYDLFNTTSFIQNLAYARFGIILTQFYVNCSRQEHAIDVL